MEEKRRATTPHGALSLDRFRAIVDSYGASPDRWPEAERVGALALMGESEEAREMRDAAARLDGVLRQLTPPAPSRVLLESLRQRWLQGTAPREAAPAGRQRSGWRLPMVWPIGRLAAFATVALVAFAVGLSVPSPLRTGAGTRTSLEPIEGIAATDETDGAGLETLPIVDGWSDIAVAETSLSELSLAPDEADQAVGIPLY